MPSVKGIPVIIYGSLRENAQRCLRYNDGKYLDFTDQVRNAHSSDSLNTFHQNIRTFWSKGDELPKSSEI